MTNYQLKAYNAITQILIEDRIPDAKGWAHAIVQYSPTSDPGYLALVIAQIRRESHFNAPDLEWLFDKIVPESVHNMGLPDPVSTIGPMQIKKGHLQNITNQPDQGQLKKDSCDIDRGVQAAVLFLDNIIKDYYPSRQIKGWASLRGRRGYTVTDQINYLHSWDEKEFVDRQHKASFQKMLSDLTESPLVLDGVTGDKTIKVCRKFSTILPPDDQRKFTESLEHELTILKAADFLESFSYQTVKAEWESVFGLSRDMIFPRLSHDPKLVFIFADYNVRKYASRLAAIQYMIAELLEIELKTDGIYGPETRAALNKFVGTLDMKPEVKKDFIKLIEKPGTKRTWLISRIQYHASKQWTNKHHSNPPFAIIPNINTHRITQKIKRLPRMHVKDYVIGSCTFFEDYYARLNRKLHKF